MASKQTLNAENLAALGAERLAGLLLDFAEGKADLKRRLRLELMGEAGGDRMAAEIGKRLGSLERTTAPVHWRKVRDFCKDIDSLRILIAERVGPSQPQAAVDLLWRFLGTADTIFGRLPGDGGAAFEVFQRAAVDVGAIAAAGKVDVKQLAHKASLALKIDSQYLGDDVIKAIAPALGPDGLGDLWSALRKTLLDDQGAFAGRDWHRRKYRRALRLVADLKGDVAAFRSAIPDDDTSQRLFAPAVAKRLLAAGRPQEALALLEEIGARPASRGFAVAVDMPDRLAEPSFEEAMIEALDATGATERAQRLRWQAFEERLEVWPLRAYLKRMPDFDDIEAEEMALDLVARHHEVMKAIDFFRLWPAPARLASLVESRPGGVNGNDYELVDAAAKVVAERYPRAATLLLRSSIIDTLVGSKWGRYTVAAQHLRECADLAGEITDWGVFDDHSAFMQRLRRNHGRKYGFWNEVNAS